jgi:hypothetical protein
MIGGCDVTLSMNKESYTDGSIQKRMQKLRQRILLDWL